MSWVFFSMNLIVTKGNLRVDKYLLPEHITSFMYRLIEVDKTDKVLDAACGSGGFLVKSNGKYVKGIRWYQF